MIYQIAYSSEAEQALIDMLIYGIQEWGEVQVESFYLDITSRIDTLKINPNRVREQYIVNGRKIRDFIMVGTPYRAPFLIDQR